MGDNVYLESGRGDVGRWPSAISAERRPKKMLFLN
jgi:hypothetical protein